MATLENIGQLEDFQWTPHKAGFQARGLFENGFGCSVIPEVTVAEDPLYELAVLRHENGKHSRICYDSGITPDVLRFLTVDDVHTVIMKVRNLPAGFSIPPDVC